MKLKDKIKIITRDVTYIRLEVKNFQIRLIIPKSQIHKADEIISNKRNWIEKHLKLIDTVIEQTKQIKIKLNKDYKTIVNRSIKKYCQRIQAYPKKIEYKKMKSCWGLCSKSGVIKFNDKIKYLKQELIDYIVCHEVCHLKIHNHSKAFKQLFYKLYGKESAKKAQSELRNFEFLLLTSKTN
ncbi:MAG: hypothetical protein KatS3mg090_0361 [Patescibacteria group bacterium]|nr:MAG: hypothetical protein KatS3mg090_0361 [Patescibacteria group bacterium]